MITEHLAYDSFGNLVDSATLTPLTDLSAHERAFNYTGRYLDTETGLQNNLHRWFDPKVGRWINEDPIGFAAGDSNLYRYVGNSPPNAIDPNGLEVQAIHKVRVAAKSFIYNIFRTTRPNITTTQDAWGPYIFNKNEDPKTDRSDTSDFRMFSAVTIHFRCSCDGKLEFQNGPKQESIRRFTTVNLGGYRVPWYSTTTVNHKTGYETEIAGGQEAPGIWGTMNLSGPNGRRIDRSTFELSWTGWGRPNRMAEPAFQNLQNRTSFNIWHHIRVIVKCKPLGRSSVTAKMTGSKFPSHRLWIDGELTDQIMQGPISALWNSSDNNPFFVK